MSGMRLPLAPAAAAGLAAALALAGCGSGGGASSPGAGGAPATPPASAPTAQAKQAVADAAASTERSTAKVHVSIVLAKPGVATTAHYLADGAVGPRGGTLQIKRRLLGAGVQDEVIVRRSGHLVLYTSPSAIKLPKGKSWLKIDLTEYGKRRYGADTTFFAGADQDPFQALDLLGSPVAKVRDLGLDWLPDHTLNTHYQGKVSLIAAARAAGASASGLEQIRTDLGSPTQTIDVWVSKAGRVARVIVSGPAHAPDGSTLDLRSTIDFSAYGSKVPIAEPPAAKVTDYFSLFPK